MSNLSVHILNGCAKFVHSILPQHCVLCGAASFDRLLCVGCDADLSHYSAPACPICALPALDGNICGTCLNHPPAFDRTLAAFSYDFPIDHLLHAFKYAGNLALVEVLDDVMTTGATLDEISRVLRGRGATEVSAWIEARTLPE